MVTKSSKTKGNKTLTNKQTSIHVTKGRFKDTIVTEGRKKAGLLELKPDSKNQLDLYITKVPSSGVYVFKKDAKKDIVKTGISKAAIKKLGL